MFSKITLNTHDKSVLYEPLVNTKTVHLPPYDVALWFIKKHANAVDHESEL